MNDEVLLIELKELTSLLFPSMGSVPIGNLHFALCDVYSPWMQVRSSLGIDTETLLLVMTFKHLA
jgi:hypothetical protein